MHTMFDSLIATFHEDWTESSLKLKTVYLNKDPDLINTVGLFRPWNVIIMVIQLLNVRIRGRQLSNNLVLCVSRSQQVAPICLIEVPQAGQNNFSCCWRLEVPWSSEQRSRMQKLLMYVRERVYRCPCPLVKLLLFLFGFSPNIIEPLLSWARLGQDQHGTVSQYVISSHGNRIYGASYSKPSYH